MQSAAPAFKNYFLVVAGMAFLLATGIALAGIFSDLSLGDEVYQYRFAKLWYETGQRPVYDPLLETNFRCLYYFDQDPLWAMGLMALWKLTGGVSKSAMQIYHAAFYALLVIAVYLLGKQLFDEKTGLYASVITASTPFLVAYSVIAYIDVPAVALATAMFLMLAKKRLFWAGVFAGLAFLMKRNTWLFIPPLAVYLLYLWHRKEISVKEIVLFALPAGLITMGELAGRYLLWGSIFFAPSGSEEVATAVLTGQRHVQFPGPLELLGKGVSTLYAWVQDTVLQAPVIAKTAAPWVTSLKGRLSAPLVPLTVDVQWGYTPSNIFFDPMSIPTYLGIPILLFFPIYLILRRRKSEDLILLLPVVFYFIEYLYFFRGQWAVRYLSPIFGLLSVLSAAGLQHIRARLGNRPARWILPILAIVCALQYGGSLAKLFATRQVSGGVREAYRYIAREAPEDSVILYPEYGLSEETGRAMVWIRLLELPQLFWQLDEQQSQKILALYRVRYILIKKERIYDDREVKHRLGYPSSWVDRIHGYGSFSRVFENDDAEILKIDLFAQKKL
jgi:4-amino-4-deoxy-L-arabinose transferase-like glycosyltransferase